MRSLNSTKKLAFCGILTALALCLSVIDSAVSSVVLPFLPGMKIGLAGGVTLFALYTLEKKYVFLILGTRCILAVFFYGSPTMLLFSLAGAFLSLFAMMLFKKSLSVVKVSVIGGISHNIAQVLVAAAVTQTFAVSWYFPVLSLTGTASGFLMGWLASVILSRFSKNINSEF